MNDGKSVAILLAAGASRRMGTPKPLLLWQGEPLVTHMARTLRTGGIEQVMVVTAPGPVGDRLCASLAGLSGVSITVNPAPERGMLSSVHAGITALGNPRDFLVSPGDLPMLEPASVITVLNRECESDRAIIAPTYKGRRGHPTRFRGFTREIMALDPVEYGLNVVLKRFASFVVEISVGSEGVLRDADTPEEWQNLVVEATASDGKPIAQSLLSEGHPE